MSSYRSFSPNPGFLTSDLSFLSPLYKWNLHVDARLCPWSLGSLDAEMLLHALYAVSLWVSLLFSHPLTHPTPHSPSSRKRMSVIARTPSGRIRLYCKGAVSMTCMWPSRSSKVHLLLGFSFLGSNYAWPPTHCDPSWVCAFLSSPVIAVIYTYDLMAYSWPVGLQLAPVLICLQFPSETALSGMRGRRSAVCLSDICPCQQIVRRTNIQSLPPPTPSREQKRSRCAVSLLPVFRWQSPRA